MGLESGTTRSVSQHLIYSQELEILAQNISKSCHPKCPIQTQYKIFLKQLMNFMIFVSPAKQKRDICTAFPAAALSSAAAAAA